MKKNTIESRLRGTEYEYNTVAELKRSVKGCKETRVTDIVGLTKLQEYLELEEETLLNKITKEKLSGGVYLVGDNIYLNLGLFDKLKEDYKNKKEDIKLVCDGEECNKELDERLSEDQNIEEDLKEDFEEEKEEEIVEEELEVVTNSTPLTSSLGMTLKESLKEVELHEPTEEELNLKKELQKTKELLNKTKEENLEQEKELLKIKEASEQILKEEELLEEVLAEVSEDETILEEDYGVLLQENVEEEEKEKDKAYKLLGLNVKLENTSNINKKALNILRETYGSAEYLSYLKTTTLVELLSMDRESECTSVKAQDIITLMSEYKNELEREVK